MKRLLKILVMLSLILILINQDIYAQGISDSNSSQENQELQDYQEQYNELLNESGANRLFEVVPDDAKDLLEKNGVTGLETDKFLNLNFFDFIKTTWEATKSAVTKPFGILFSGIGVILLCALLNSLKSGFNNASYERVFSVVSVMCVATTIIIPIAQIITKVAILIKQVSNFMLSFIPVYVGIITASGRPLSAVSYNASLIGIVQVISRISASVLVPLLAIYLAFCLIGSTSSHINIEGITKTVKTTVIVVLSFLMTIFVGLLTVQGVVATSTDTVSLKAVKFGLSAFLPVVGTAISEALNSVQGCMGVIKSAVGGFGIIAVVSAFLPSIITILMMQFSLMVTASVSEALDTPRITALMKSASSVLSLILGILLVFFVMLVVSIAIMLALSTAGA